MLKKRQISVKQVTTYLKQLTLMLLLLVYGLQSLSVFRIESNAKSFDMSISAIDDTDGEVDDTTDLSDESNEPLEYTDILNVCLLQLSNNYYDLSSYTKMTHNHLCSHFPIIHTEVPSPPPDSMS